MAELGGIELRHLRYFLAVADVGTVTAAARELNIAQPSLSQQISTLERRAGAKLFHRTARGVELTAAGGALASAARKAFGVLEAGLGAVRAAVVPVLVGICSGVSGELLERLESDLGGEVRFEPVESAAQPALLRSGRLDLGVLRMPVPVEGLAVTELSQEPLGVVVHRSHPLAKESTVDWPDLEGQRLLWFPEERAPGYANAVLDHIAAAGWSPVPHRVPQSGHTLFKHVLARNADLVALRPHAAVSADAELVWIPLQRNAPRERMALVRSLPGGR
ncbi:LysR family transcriptional regulator [Allokutzneria oryzae]|uniref:LysR family transcriptional regulator n=1 Tax=Allokutzneria oryzae TaxID=1378989 RepID=A0ABV6A3D1_9PSEU